MTLQEDINLLMNADHYDPHRVLGLHVTNDNEKVIRIWRPGASQVFIELFSNIVEMQKVYEAGLFEMRVPAKVIFNDYRIYHTNGMLAHDPYSFMPTFSEFDSHLFANSVHYEIYSVMGGRIFTHQDIVGARFIVWTPSAKRVSIVGDFNNWNGLINPMRSMGSSGVWEIFVPGLMQGDMYKFEIKTQDNNIRIKADPYAYYSQIRPNTASRLFDIDRYQWNDQKWISNRSDTRNSPKAMNIYEVHLGSWKRKDGKFMNYRELANELAEYCTEMGFTHLELMPIAEHPLDESWGYQVSGFYSVTSRYGTPEDFQYFVDHLHSHNIGIFLDWVPGHFPTDDFSLAKFDGTSLYEHEDVRRGYHPHWNTCIFNYGRHEVSNFLIGNALFWLDKMHIDGLRVDAVASMLYLDYGRNEGEWVPNEYGGKENIEAIEFIKHLNSIVHQRFPGVNMIAEESTAFTGVSHPLENNGLGFDLKWNMGWMNDTLRYFSEDPLYRCYHHDLLTFGLIYAFSERFTLVLSHDEVVHGKRSLLDKMPGDMWQKFANLRLLYSYMICQPGKNLLFMGGEFGQWNEWYCNEEIHWILLKFPAHDGLRTMIKELNHFVLSNPPLWERDFDYSGFAWIDFHDRKNSVISYRRRASRGELVCVHNFTPVYIPHYDIYLNGIDCMKEVFNSDLARYGGSDKNNKEIKILKNQDSWGYGFQLQLAPLATMIFKISYL